MNSVILIGRIGKDLELKKTPSGKSVINFSLAVNKFSKGEEKSVDWINCQAWNQTAELMYQYLGKGSLIGVEGRIQTRNYDGKDGKKVYITEVVVERVEFLDTKKSEQRQSVDTYEYEEPAYEPMNLGDDDLPF